MPDTLEVAIRYRLPESVVSGLVAGARIEPLIAFDILVSRVLSLPTKMLVRGAR